MDRLEIAIELIRDAMREKARIRRLDKEIENLRGLELEGSEYWDKRYQIEKKYSPLPHKATVNDNLKVARRILNDERL